MDAQAPGWIWQVIGAAGGLGLGLLAGAWWLRRDERKLQAQNDALRTDMHDGQPDGSSPAPRLSQITHSRPPEMAAPALPNTPQLRLLERLRQDNLNLTEQLRTMAAQHSKLVNAKDSGVAGAKEEYDRQVEELRQAHSKELKHLMALMLEQVHGLHKTHENHVKALEAEIERVRRESRLAANEPLRTTFQQDSVPTRVEGAAFAATLLATEQTIAGRLLDSTLGSPR